MPAADHLHPVQLQMFMSGRELHESITGSYDASMRENDMEGLWKLKLRQSKRSGFAHGNDIYASVKEKGWSSDDPNYGHVNLTHKTVKGAIPAWDKDQRTVDDAHHRIAAAAHLEGLKKPQGWLKKSKSAEHYIPVTHWDNRDYGMG